MALFGRPSQQDDLRAQAWRDWLRRRHPLAIASFVLGIISLIEFGVLLLPELGGIVLGIAAIAKLRNRLSEAGHDRGHYLAAAGIVISVLSLLIALFIYRIPPR